jgi:hypothetical protein
VLEIDGHDLGAIDDAFATAADTSDGRATVIVAKTVKGRGFSEVERCGPATTPARALRAQRREARRRPAPLVDDLVDRRRRGERTPPPCATRAITAGVSERTPWRRPSGERRAPHRRSGRCAEAPSTCDLTHVAVRRRA